MRTIARLGAGLTLATLLLTGSSSPLGAEERSKGDPQGEPKGFKAGLSARYAVWHNKHGWQLRTTTAKKTHHFVGSIKTDGHLTRIHSHHLEKEGKAEDHWIVSPDKKEVLFDFKTDKGIDGITFHVSKDAKHIKFNLLIDGKHYANKVLIGHNGHHPHQDPFILPAHPHAKK